MVKKNIMYYIISIIVFLAIALCSPLRQIGLKAETISVIEAIIKLPEKLLYQTTIEGAFNVCQSQWMYALLPISASIPSAFYIHNEIKSKFFLGVEFRKGKYKYIYSRYFYSAMSAGVIILIGVFVYAVVVCSIFPINSIENVYGEETKGILECIIDMMEIALQMVLYGMAMSVVATFLLYLKNNLCVSMSLLYIIAHVLRDFHVRENSIISIALCASLLILYGVMWKFRSEYI